MGLFKFIWDTRRRALILLALIVLLGAFLRLYQLGAGGYGNLYYAAAVKSMLTSWHNFFFVAFEPGGSVSVDKPPLGLWIEAGSALIFGLNGFALALPNVLAGILAIPLLYRLVRRPFGRAAGLVSALVLAVTPVTIATERNNTIDGMLVLALLLAAWGFASAARSGRLRPLLLGSLALGLAFNIKELEAFMPLPAFYAVYLFAAPVPWLNRLKRLGLATLLLVVVSFAWPLAVDLTPPSQRPYVGSSTDNSEFGLMFGWNGISRLVAEGGPGGGPGSFSPNPVTPPGATGFGNDVPPGVARLFTEPLVEEASWLLPLALLGLVFVPLAGLGGRGVLANWGMWGAWLLPEALYFSFTTGLFHPYYLILLGPPLAALVGAATWAVRRISEGRRWLGFGLAALAVVVTASFQLAILMNYPQYAALAALVTAAGLGGLFLAAWKWSGLQARIGAALLGIALLAAPLTWCLAVTLDPQVDQTGLPSASQYTGETGFGLAGGFGGPPGVYPGEAGFGGRPGIPPGRGPGASPGPNPGIGGAPSQASDALVAYLEANTPSTGYLAATVSAQEAAPLILTTGRPVLTFGGFTGSDPVIDASRLAQMVSAGQVRFVLASGNLQGQKPEIWSWVSANCRLSSFGNAIYDCAQ